MGDAPSFPTVTDDRIDSGWELVDERVETLFELPGMRVRGAIRQYEDRETGAALTEATDGDVEQSVRFFAATKLGFDPGLPPGTLSSVVLRSIRQEARRTFKQRLQERGLEDVSRGRRERTRVDGARLRLTSYDAVYPLSGDGGEGGDRSDDQGIPVTGWVGVWHDDAFQVATGGYPSQRLTDVFGLDATGTPLDASPAAYRNELFDLMQSVR
jgi:hypothetical protein